MARTSIRSAPSLPQSKTTSSSTQTATPEATMSGNSSADNMQVWYFPDATRRPRSVRPRRFVQKAVAGTIPPVDSELVDSEPVQVKIKHKLHSNKTLRLKVGAEDEPQDVVDPKVMKLGITGPKLKCTMRVFDPLDPDTNRLRILADVCHQHLLALVDGSSSSDKS